MLSLPLFAQMSKTQLQDMYLTYLRSQNIEAVIDSDGDIAFDYDLPSYSAIRFYIIVDEDDQTFFQILLLDICPLSTAQERNQAHIAAAFASMYADTLKVYVNNQGTDVWVSGEVFLASPQDFRFVFPKMMLQFEVAIESFYDYLF
jgi:hypothetical protein